MYSNLLMDASIRSESMTPCDQSTDCHPSSADYRLCHAVGRDERRARAGPGECQGGYGGLGDLKGVPEPTAEEPAGYPLGQLKRHSNSWLESSPTYRLPGSTTEDRTSDEP
ncbi:unnamed protein product [Rhizoctonia solani]|uniref:Uncharacterized protein n=1 Tax=Rhizoctonia solani TaxID=456999 RepID=A0A8H3C8H8_9AGAM|nr:unnamed protein product [Rhizoctonia solani]